MKILFIILLSSIAIERASAQLDSFDIIKYKDPDGWTKNESNAVLTWSTANQQTGGFCIIAVYPASPSSGDASKDFENEWNRVVASSFTTNGLPQAQTKEGGGWKILTGGAKVQKDTFPMIAILTLFSGHGKLLSILTTLNDQSYANAVDQFIASIRENKNAVANNGSTAGTISTIPGAQPSQPRPEGVVGTWSTTGASLANYVSPSGAYAGDASIVTSESYELKQDGSYVYKFFGYRSGVMYYCEMGGVYTVSGDEVTLKEKTRKGGYLPYVGDESRLLKKEPKTYKFFIGDYQGTTALHLHNDNDYYLWKNFQWQPFKLVQQ